MDSGLGLGLCMACTVWVRAWMSEAAGSECMGMGMGMGVRLMMVRPLVLRPLVLRPTNGGKADPVLVSPPPPEGAMQVQPPLGVILLDLNTTQSLKTQYLQVESEGWRSQNTATFATRAVAEVAE